MLTPVGSRLSVGEGGRSYRPRRCPSRLIRSRHLIAVVTGLVLAGIAPLIIWWLLVLPSTSWYAIDPQRGRAEGFGYLYTVDSYQQNRPAHTQELRCSLDLG